jgi:hypothetical protein
MRKTISEAKAWRRLAEWCVLNPGWLCWHIQAWAEGGESWRWPIAKPFRAPWREMFKRVSQHADMGACFDDGPVPGGG